MRCKGMSPIKKEIPRKYIHSYGYGTKWIGNINLKRKEIETHSCIINDQKIA